MRLAPLLVAIQLAWVVMGVPASAGQETAATQVGSGEEIEEIQVLGFRTGLLADDPSSFATVIELNELQAEFKSLEEVLAQSVGVQVRRFGGAGERSEVAIRGSTSSQVVVMVDGVRLNSSRGGGVDLSDIPLAFYESVEIARGGGSVSQGSGAIGGVIDLKTPRPGAVPATRLAVSGGSFGTWEGSLLRSAHTGFIDYILGYRGFKTDGDYLFLRPLQCYQELCSPYSPPTAKRVNNRREKHAVLAGLGRELGRVGYLQLQGDLNYASQGEPGLDALSGPTAGQRLAAHQRSLRGVVRLSLEGEDFGGLGGEFDVSLYHRFDHTHFEDPAADPPEGLDDRSNDSTLGASVSNFWQGELGRADHRLGFELAARRDAFDADRPPNQSRWTLGLTLREEARLSGDLLSVFPALRLDWIEGFGERWIPSFGVVYEPLRWLRLKGNVELSFRAPSFDELYFPDKGYIRGNPALEAEEALNGDVGFELVFDEFGPFRDVRFEASYFHNQIENSVVWVLISPDVVAPVNTQQATARGYELLASLDLLGLVRLSANHTGVDARFDGNRKRLPGRAESETSVRLEIGDRDSWKLVGEMLRTGDIFASRDGSRIIPARTVWNGSASFNIARLPRIGLAALLSKLWLTFRANNVGDVAQRDTIAFPQPGRTLTLALEGQW